jgi:Uncharacterized conserved protein
MAALHLGLCGWNGSQRSYFEEFDCIEIQSTFYDPPNPQVARKWRSAAPPSFKFCIKAWQLITHSAASPTYRRLRSPIAASEREAVGSFRQTEQVWQAWERTLEHCPSPECKRNLVSMSEVVLADQRESHQLLGLLPPGEQRRHSSGVGTARRSMDRRCRTGRLCRVRLNSLRGSVRVNIRIWRCEVLAPAWARWLLLPLYG